MAMRSVVGKLKALTQRMPRFGATPPKDVLGYQRPVIDPTKFNSLKELNEALPALLEKKFKAQHEAYERYLKAYDRVTYATAAAAFGGTTWFAIWFLVLFLRIIRHRGEQQ